MLDEQFRRRVSELANRGDDAPGLDEAARERILARVASEGPLLLRRARRARLAVLSAGPLLAAAAAAIVFSSGVARVPALAAADQSVPARPSVMACADREPPRGAGFTGRSGGKGGEELDLGRTALVRAQAGTRARLTDAQSCKTIVALDDGTVAVHARDLGGGEFVVRARDGQVVVKGTVFAVTQTADAFVVEVSEGRVSVTDRTGEHRVGKGERYALRGGQSGTRRLEGVRDGEIREAVDLPKIVGFDSLVPERPAEAAAGVNRTPGRSSPGAAELETGVAAGEPGGLAVALPEEAAPSGGAAEGTVDLLSEADAAQRAGRFDVARELYRRVAMGRGATAEAAWVALARMELSLGRASQARAATKQRQQRFGQGTLAPESLWIDVRAYRQSGELGLARELAAELSRRWPGSPQGRAAKDWLSSAH